MSRSNGVGIFAFNGHWLQNLVAIGALLTWPDLLLARPGSESIMAAYFIANVDITEAEAFEEYKREVRATEQRYGGKYLGRGGLTKVLEGDWEPHRLVISPTSTRN